jgi:hypothetical protein
MSEMKESTLPHHKNIVVISVAQTAGEAHLIHRKHCSNSLTLYFENNKLGELKEKKRSRSQEEERKELGRK